CLLIIVKDFCYETSWNPSRSDYLFRLHPFPAFLCAGVGVDGVSRKLSRGTRFLEAGSSIARWLATGAFFISQSAAAPQSPRSSRLAPYRVQSYRHRSAGGLSERAGYCGGTNSRR